MNFFRRFFVRIGPDKSSFWYVFKKQILLEKGTELIASCLAFIFLSGPLVLFMHILGFINFPDNDNGFGCVFIFAIVMGIIYFISAEYRGYTIIKEFATRSIPPKSIKSYEGFIDDMMEQMDEEYFSKQTEKRIKISDAINLMKKINKTEEIDIK